MKLHQHTVLYLSVSLLIIIGIWGSVFYSNVLDEVYDSIDDGLSNSKVLIIQKALRDTTVLAKREFEESNYAITPLPATTNLDAPDRYIDTLMDVQNDNDQEPVRMLTTVFGTSDGAFYELRIISSMVEEEDLLSDLLIALSFMYLTMLVCIILVNNFILRRIWKPFYKLLDRLRNFRLGKDEIFELPPTKVEEFDLLNSTVHSLLKRNIDIYESQKQFIADASHELQTPVAISINKLELLVERNGLEDEVAAAIGEVIGHMERLKKLNRALLLISKIENRQYAPDEEQVDLNAMTKKLLDNFMDMMEFKELKLVLREDAPLRFPMNGYLAEVLLTNLLKNAIFHNIPQGELHVWLKPDAILIENTGVAAPLNASRIFERFYKESSDKHSNGLGLYIAKSIAGMYGITLRYHYQDRHVFSLEYPR